VRTHTTHSEETKAAVMAALLTGQSVSEAARRYNIPKGTVSDWRKQAVGDTVTPTQKRERIGELVLAYLSTALETLEAQARMFRDEDWLRKQNAADVAVLHGVVTDKSIRLLEALAASQEAAEG
jgi:transposase-like protein